MVIEKKLFDKLWRVFYVFVVVAIMGGLSFYFIAGIILEQVESHGNDVVLLARTKIGLLEREAEAALALSLLFIERMEADNASPEELESFLRRYSDNMQACASSNSVFFSSLRGVVGGRLIRSSNLPLPSGYRAETRPWYTSAVQGRGAVVFSSPYINAATGGNVIAVGLARPSLKGGGINVIALDIDLSIIASYIGEIQLATGGYGFLLDRDLVVIAHINEKYLGETLHDLGGHFSELAARISTQGTVSAAPFVDADGNERVIFVQKLFHGWYVGSVTPTAVYYERVYGVAWVLGGVGLLVALSISALLLRLHAAKESSDTRSLSKSNFLAQMSHEIRTPMNAIVGLSELILRHSEGLSLKTVEYAVGIKQASVKLLAVVNAILDFSKIESGKLIIVTGSYLFSSVINDVINIIRMRMQEKSLHFVTLIDGALPNTLIGDVVRIRQILLNLLSNAVKYTQRGFISLKIEGTKSADGRIVLIMEVADSGIGIKSADIGKLFKDFVRLDLPRNVRTEGTGLGLSITKNLLELMDGDIRVESEYGRGSSFIVTLPQRFEGADVLAVVENPGAYKVLVYETRRVCSKSLCYALDNLGIAHTSVKNRPEFHAAMEKGGYTHIFLSSYLYDNMRHLIRELAVDAELFLLAEEIEVPEEIDVRTLIMPVHSLLLANLFNRTEGQRYIGDEREAQSLFHAPQARILVVDDIKTNISVAEGLLLPYGMKMDFALSGREAVALVKKNAYDLIFMDHMMPGLDGIETTKLIRTLDDERFQTVPIIALTASAVSGMQEVFLANGMNDFISKPIDIFMLHSLLLKWIPKEKQEKRSVAAKVSKDTTDIVLEGLDTAQGIVRTGGLRAGYVKTLAFFYDDALSRINVMKSALETDDIKTFTMCMHALKSAAGNIGAVELPDMAAALEEAGRKGDTPFIRTYVDIFIEKLHVVLGALDVFLCREKGDADTVPDGADTKLLKRELSNLREALKKFNAGAIEDAMEALQSGALSEESRHAVDELERHILLFEYEAAAAVIDALVARMPGYDRRKTGRRQGNERRMRNERRMGSERRRERDAPPQRLH